MRINSGLLGESTPPSPVDRKLSPVRMLGISVLLIFTAEIVAMTVIYFLPLPNYVVESLTDAVIMVLLILPGLYYLQFKPLLKEIDERTRAEQALHSSQELLRRVLELLPVGVWITDKSGKIIHGNPASQNIWSGARYVGIEQYGEYKGWWPDTGRRIKPDEWAAARAILRGETSLHEEIEIECFDGSHKIILNSAVPIRDEQNTVQGTIIVNQDITERRLKENALIRTNELLEKVFASVDTLIAYMDRNFNFLRVNETYAQGAGHPVEHFTGKNHFDLYPNEENEAIFKQVVETGEPFTVFEKPFEYADDPERGTTYWNWSLQPVTGPDGLVEGVVLSLVDVTDRKKAEIQLERQNQELRELVKAERAARQAAETLRVVAQALTQTLDLENVIQTLLDHAKTIIDADTYEVILFQEEDQLSASSQRGFDGWAERRNINPFLADRLANTVMEQIQKGRKSVIFPESELYTSGAGTVRPGPLRTWLFVPIFAKEMVIGFVELSKAEGDDYDKQGIQWIEALASQAAVAIQNAWLFEQVRSSSERLQSLTRKLVEVQEDERQTIARELHDEAGQSLSFLMIGLSQLEQDPNCPPHFRQQLLGLETMTNGVLENLHRLAMNLRPVALDHIGLVAALEQMAEERYSEQVTIQFKAIGFKRERLPRDMETALYRIVQEALTNVVRHAQASNVGILLEKTENRVKVFVEDNGIGFNPDQSGDRIRLGLVGMRERAEMFGGTLTIESSPGTGTSIIVEVPDVYPDSNW